MNTTTKKTKSIFSDIINKDTVWSKIKKYIYIITTSLILIFLILLSILILNIFMFFKINNNNKII